MTLIYRPKHPRANENGLVDRNLVDYERQGTAPYVISDTMEMTRHMADNKHYDSKAKFREVTRAHGCVEVGTETAHMLKPRERANLSHEKRREDIKRAIYEVRNGRRS